MGFERHSSFGFYFTAFSHHKRKCRLRKRNSWRKRVNPQERFGNTCKSQHLLRFVFVVWDKERRRTPRRAAPPELEDRNVGRKRGKKVKKLQGGPRKKRSAIIVIVDRSAAHVVVVGTRNSSARRRQGGVPAVPAICRSELIRTVATVGVRICISTFYLNLSFEITITWPRCLVRRVPPTRIPPLLSFISFFGWPRPVGHSPIERIAEPLHSAFAFLCSLSTWMALPEKN